VGGRTDMVAIMEPICGWKEALGKVVQGPPNFVTKSQDL
jgi:hypothetical protein